MQDLSRQPLGDGPAAVTPRPAPIEEDSREWLDLGDIVRLYRRHWKLFAAIVLVCTGAAIAAAFLLPRTYEGVARVRIDPQRKAVLDTSVTSQNFQTDQARVDTEVQLMRSLNIADAVVRRLELWRDPRFQPEREEGEPVAVSGSDEQIRQIARGVGKRFAVRRNGNSFIVDLVYTAPDAESAAQIANAFAEAYVDASGRLQSEQARDQSRYLERQMVQLGNRVRQGDARIASYRANTGITQSGSGGTVTDQQIGPVSSEFATAQSAAAEANGRLAAAQSQVRSGAIFAVSDVLNSTVITQLRAQRADLLKQKADLDNRYGPNHPDARRVQGQLTSVDDLIRDEAQRIVSRLQADAQAANARAGALAGRLASLKGEQAANTRAAVTADSLQRENDASRQIYEKLAEQAQQTGQQAQVLQPSGVIVQFALPPQDPNFPNRKIFALAGLLAGLMLGSIAAFLLDYVRRGIRSPRDFLSLGVQFLVSLPLLSRRHLRSLARTGRPPWDAVVAKPMSSFAEAVRTVRTSMQAIEPADGAGRVVTFISSLPGEGKSHTAISVAQVCAASGDPTIIIDCDMRRPSVQKLLPSVPEHGLVSVLTGEARLESAIFAREDTGLHVLPVTAPDFTPRDLLGTEAFREILAELRRRYDVIVLDVPPILAVASVREVARQCDGVFYLVKWDATPRGAVKSGIRLLQRDGVPVTGMLLNMVDTRQQASIGEDDPAYYQSAYAAYYQE
jgi:polysaccharide biosynthesis transport protein